MVGAGLKKRKKKRKCRHNALGGGQLEYGGARKATRDQTKEKEKVLNEGRCVIKTHQGKKMRGRE